MEIPSRKTGDHFTKIEAVEMHEESNQDKLN